MLRLKQCLFLFLIPWISTAQEPNGPVTDFDGNTYPTVKIGAQVWMAENLRVTHFSDGTPIPYVSDSSDWDNLGYTEKAYCWYDNNPINGSIYGALYNWSAAMNGASSSDDNPNGVQGVCPAGWYLPDDEDWKILEGNLGMSLEELENSGFRGTNEGGKLKETGTSHWVYPNEGGTNQSGFTALPAGIRRPTAEYIGLTTGSSFWASSDKDDDEAMRRYISSGSSQIHRGNQNKKYGFSVRCLKKQFVHIPDSAFLYALIDEGIDNNGDSLISYSEAELITQLELWEKGISDLTGIEAFKNIEYLGCENNSLTSLSIEGFEFLEELHCRGNQLTTLNVSGCPNLMVLNCKNNRLTSIDVSGFDSLVELNCRHNLLTNIDVSGCTGLHDLFLKDNRLTEIDLSTNLSLLDCELSDNNFLELNLILNQSLTGIDLSNLPSLTDVCVWTMPFPPDGMYVYTTGSPNIHFSDSCNLHHSEVNIPDNFFYQALIYAGVDISGDGNISFEEVAAVHKLDISGPKNEYWEPAGKISDLTGIQAFINLDTLMVGNHYRLSTIDLTGNPKLRSLWCWDCYMDSLDLSRNPKLTTLNCTGNRLIRLDLSNNPDLVNLWCAWNNLDSLDLSNNPALETLDCFENLLTSLDVSNNPNLRTLYCNNDGWTDNENRIRVLDLSNNPNLAKVGCSSIGLEELILPESPVISYLSCGYNNLTSLNLANDTALLSLYCGYNDIAALDITSFSSLENLSCRSNQLDSLDLSMATGLVMLDCGYNKIHKLDATNCTQLERLNCENNMIKTLDLSSDGVLNYLNCTQNLLTALDLSNNTMIINAWCRDNLIKSISLHNCQSLEELGCNSNQLYDLNLNGCPNLKLLNCSDNYLGFLDLQNLVGLEKLYCASNNLNNLVTYHCPLLSYLQCQENQLKFLNVTENPELTSLWCSDNNLTRLNLSSNSRLTAIGIENMGSLEQVCVWQIPHGMRVYEEESPNAYFTTECETEIVHIPDSAFLHALIELGVDTDGDSLISYAEAEIIHELSIFQRSISDLTGIEAFVSLESLNCSENKLTTLDLSSNFILKVLLCTNNQLLGLDISNCRLLNSLVCSSNPLLNLDISKNQLLSDIEIEYMVSLGKLCVWTLPFPTQDVTLDKEGSHNVVFTTYCNDYEPPTVPAGLSMIEITDSTIEIAWDPSMDNEALAGYNIYVDSDKNGSTTDTIHTLIDLTEDTEYLISVSAVDSAYNESAQSFPLLLTTKAPDREPPTVPENLQVWNITTNSMELLWDPSTDNVAVSGYRIYLNETMSNSVVETSLQLHDLNTGTPYEISVSAFDEANNESDRSVSITATTLDENTGIKNTPSTFGTYEFNIFPNPANDIITIQSKYPGRYLVSISSATGKLLETCTMSIGTNQLDLSAFQIGIYYITIRSKDFVTTRKIIKL